jgi:hypothetical protein
VRKCVALSLLLPLLAACSTREVGQTCEIEEREEDYTACRRDDDCLAPSQCTDVDWAYGEGTLCTRACESELDCPSVEGFHGRCIQIAGVPSFICVKGCESDSDCGWGQVCQPLTIGGRVCLP